jgi:hypothetical protein
MTFFFILIRKRKKTLKGDKREREGGLIDLLMNAQAHTHTHTSIFIFFIFSLFSLLVKYLLGEWLISTSSRFQN